MSARETIRNVLLVHYADSSDPALVADTLMANGRAEILAEEKSSPDEADAVPGFFRPGRAYLSPYSHLQVVKVTRHPATGERRVVGWYKPRESGWWQIRDLDPADHEYGVWTDVTEAGEPA